jgi:heme/copper-type cytochrome/quinol oxidase subunit 2
MESSELLFAARQRDVSSSGVSWGAAIAGAFVAAALSLIMLALGAGLGLSAVSPWSNVGAAASTVGTIAIIWLIVIQIVASAMGGYLAGRLRTRWQIHNDEVHFRDTANGLIAWAVGVVLTVSFLATAATTMAGGTVNVTESSSDAAGQDPTAYFVDRLFRSDHPGTGDLAVQAEAGRIFTHSLRDVSASDADYLAQLVAAKTGLNPNDAQQRVSQTIADARQTEDEVRKATAHILLWIFIGLLTGAFCASYAATIGGRQRDHVQTI